MAGSRMPGDRYPNLPIPNMLSGAIDCRLRFLSVKSVDKDGAPKPTGESEGPNVENFLF